MFLILYIKINLFNLKADKKVMKTLVILFADFMSLHIFDKIFSGKSAFERSVEWAENFLKTNEGNIEIFCSKQIEGECSSNLSAAGKNIPLISADRWSVSELFTKLDSEAKKTKSDTILFAWADCPFINLSVTQELLELHKESVAEYTFADGYPEGLCPEVLDAGAAAVLAELSKNQKAQDGSKNYTRTGIFDFIKLDINSFEVETLIADEDARLFRINFNCSTKGNTQSCIAMFENGVDSKSINEISDSACKNPAVLKTVPGYYSIQVTDRCSSVKIYKPEEMESPEGKNFMALSDFKNLIKKISEFSETAVVSLSAWGEAPLHPDFVEMVRTVLEEPGLTVLIEGEMKNVTEEMCISIKNTAGSDSKIIWIVTLDSVNASQNEVILLEKYFSGNVYPQFVRMNENEDQLEGFYRFWSAKDSPSKGNLIIQKYDNLCGFLPDRKPADLSPLERNACWHIRRDMTILVDGSVPFCRGHLKTNLIGNAFSEEFSTIWKKLDGEVKNHLENKYCGKCGSCDEYYTFNF